jgi:hypothetical protein
MRWVAIGLSVAQVRAIAASERARSLAVAVKQRRDAYPMEPAGGDPGTIESRLAAMNLGQPDLGSLCLPWLGGETRPHCRQ